MATKLVIKNLRRAIKQQHSQDAINGYTEILIGTIKETINEPLFYSLPFDQISNIIRSVDFAEPSIIEDPIAALQTIIQKTSETHQEKAILLLNDIKLDNLPELALNEIISVVSKFKSNELLTKLGEAYEYNECLVQLVDTRESDRLKMEITMLKEELRQKSEEIDNSQKRIQELEEQNKSINEKVFDACEQGSLSRVQYHFEVLHANKEAKCDRVIPNYGQCFSLTALHVAVAYGHFDIVRYLCEVQNVNAEARDNNNISPLHIACYEGYLAIVKYLCEVQNVDVEATTFDGDTPLHIACFHNNLQIVQYLCDVQHVNVEAVTSGGWTPLHISCYWGNLHIVKYLCFVKNINKGIKTNNGDTPYAMAKRGNRTEVIKFLERIGVRS